MIEEEIIICEALGIERSDLLSHPELTLQDHPRLREFKKRLDNCEPFAYIAGYQPFMGLNFFVNKRVLIPRPETELLVEAVINYANQCSTYNCQLSILDLGTGSGSIAVTLAKHIPNSIITATDISRDALNVAKKNSLYHKVKDKITFIESDLFNDLGNMKFDIIVSNPPYIPSETIETLEPQVKFFEPRKALDGGKDGLDVIRNILSQAPTHLKEGGQLFMEIGIDESIPVKNHLIKNNYKNIKIIKDYAGIDRIISASYHDITWND